MTGSGPKAEVQLGEVSAGKRPLAGRSDTLPLNIAKNVLHQLALMVGPFLIFRTLACILRRPLRFTTERVVTKIQAAITQGE